MSFTLHPRLEADTVLLVDLGLSRLLLMKDALYPWLILVPAKPGLREIHDLEATDRARLIEEIASASRALQDLYAPDKINVGQLGNLVPQLHIHVIARFIDDPAWPGPVWGKVPPQAYEPKALQRRMDELKGRLS
jgi:diadenosine tetraphosphate (Ap4A) HIT family hydrolase